MPETSPQVVVIAGPNGAGKTTLAPFLLRRRYFAGLRNFRALYRPLADTWAVYDNSESGPIIVAQSARNEVGKIIDRNLWHQSMEVIK